MLFPATNIMGLLITGIMCFIKQWSCNHYKTPSCWEQTARPHIRTLDFTKIFWVQRSTKNLSLHTFILYVTMSDQSLKVQRVTTGATTTHSIRQCVLIRVVRRCTFLYLFQQQRVFDETAPGEIQEVPQVQFPAEWRLLTQAQKVLHSFLVLLLVQQGFSSHLVTAVCNIGLQARKLWWGAEKKWFKCGSRGARSLNSVRLVRWETQGGPLLFLPPWTHSPSSSGWVPPLLLSSRIPLAARDVQEDLVWPPPPKKQCWILSDFCWLNANITQDGDAHLTHSASFAGFTRSQSTWNLSQWMNILPSTYCFKFYG